MACGCQFSRKVAVGDSETEATHGLILDRFEHHTLGRSTENALPFLQQKHQKTIANKASRFGLGRSEKRDSDEEEIHSF